MLTSKLSRVSDTVCLWRSLSCCRELTTSRRWIGIFTTEGDPFRSTRCMASEPVMKRLVAMAATRVAPFIVDEVDEAD